MGGVHPFKCSGGFARIPPANRISTPSTPLHPPPPPQQVLDLDISFHLDRKTGRLSRILERGTRSVQMLYRALLFTFAPTALELVFVIALLATQFSAITAGLVAATFVLYVSWTLVLTQMAVEVRRRTLILDNLTTTKAVDALLNAETVALFNNRCGRVGGCWCVCVWWCVFAFGWPVLDETLVQGGLGRGFLSP